MVWTVPTLLFVTYFEVRAKTTADREKSLSKHTLQHRTEVQHKPQTIAVL
jgi:hypothetical protein